MDTEQALLLRKTMISVVPWVLTLMLYQNSNGRISTESDDPLKARYKPLFEESIVDEEQKLSLVV